MSTDQYIHTREEKEKEKKSKDTWGFKPQFTAIGVVGIGVVGGLLIATRFVDISITPKWRLQKIGAPTSVTINTPPKISTIDTTLLQQQVLPSSGVVLPISWRNLGKRMIADGVIDETKFRAIFSSGLSTEDDIVFTGDSTQPIVMNAGNSRFLLDIFWAFGLANKNEILEKGEMADKQYGGAGNFASTGGWTLSQGKAMDHYSKHSYIILNPQQQALVDRVSRTIYRPCCNNSTHFPDCNHGMAMLGLLELLASQNVSEGEIYKIALVVNSYWFPQTYLDLASYFEEQGQKWSDVDPKTVLGLEYSSAQGYQQIRAKIQSLPKPATGGGGCGT